VHSI